MEDRLMCNESLFNKKEIKKLADKHGVKSITYIDYPKIIIDGRFREVFTYQSLEDLFKHGGDVYLYKNNVYRGFSIL